jgi:predicted peptidase
MINGNFRFFRLFLLGGLGLQTMLLNVRAQEVSIAPGKTTELHLEVTVGKDSNQVKVKVPALLYAPPSYAERESWPLLLFLHGYGECGDGDFAKLRIHGPIKLAEARGDFDFVVLSPQSPDPLQGLAVESMTPDQRFQKIIDAWDPNVLMEVVRKVQKNAKIDPQRIYVSGLSMGGFGTWRLCGTYPDWFAAAVPICGGGKKEFGSGLKEVPVWAFHGAKDSIVPLSESEVMVEAVQEAGGDVKLTVYPEAEHDSWTLTYQNPEVYRWLLGHRKARIPAGASDLPEAIRNPSESPEK